MTINPDFNPGEITNDPIVNKVVDIVMKRHMQGMEKFGKTMDSNERPLDQWIDETIEEEEIPEDVSEALLYHIDRNAGVDKNIFRPGSSEFFNLFREVRALSKAGDYTLSSAEYELIRDTDIGRFAMYEGQIVPLDYPMLYEDQIQEAEYKGRKVLIRCK